MEVVNAYVVGIGVDHRLDRDPNLLGAWVREVQGVPLAQELGSNAADDAILLTDAL